MNYRGRAGDWMMEIDGSISKNKLGGVKTLRKNKHTRRRGKKEESCPLIHLSRCYFIPSSEISIKMSINCSRNKFWIIFLVTFVPKH